MKRFLLTLIALIAICFLYTSVQAWTGSWDVDEVPYTKKTAAPTVNDDSYIVPYLWVDETNDKFYLLIDNTPGAGSWTELGSGSPYAGVIIVATAGGDYTDLSDAIDAATINDTVLVFPGTYTDTMTFAASNITVNGIGQPGTVIVQQVDAAVVDFNTRTNICVSNMTLQTTAATTAIATITGTTGSIKVNNCQSGMTTTADIAAVNQPAVGLVSGAGTLRLGLGSFTYAHTGDGGGTAQKGAFRVGTGGEIHLEYLDASTITNSGTELITAVIVDTASTGIVKMHNCIIEIIDTGTLVTGLAYLGGTGTTHEFDRNTIHVDGTGCAVAWGFYAADTASTSKFFYNHIHVDGATTNYSYYIGTGATVTSHFDDLVAVDGYSNLGTFHIVSSFADGDLTATGNIEGATLTEGGNAVPNATDHLGFFAVTTSAQLFGILNDETGSSAGALGVFSISPIFTTDITIQGLTGVSAILNMIADAAEDNSDKWRLVAADGGDWTLEAKATGSWVAVLTIDNAGNANMTSATTTPTTAPGISAIDSNQDDPDVTGKLYWNASHTGTGAEIADWSIQSMGAQGNAGDLETAIWWDGDKQSLILPSSNDPVTPTLTIGSVGTGIYVNAANQWSFAFNGIQEWLMTSGVFQSKHTNGPTLISKTPTTTVPTLVPAGGDTDSGDGWAAADAPSMIAGGVEAQRWTEAARTIETDTTVCQNNGGMELLFGAAHDLVVDDVVQVADGGGTICTGLSASTNYYVLAVGSTTTATLSASRGGGIVGWGADAGTAFTSYEMEITASIYGDANIFGFTKLGNDALAIKMKKYASTMHANEGGEITIAHGLTAAKIIGIQALVDSGNSTDLLVPPSFTANNGFQYDAWINATDIKLKNHATNSEDIVGDPVTIVLTYEE